MPAQQADNFINAPQQARVDGRQAAYIPPLRRRTIADYDAPNQYHQDRAAINIPQPRRQDFEIKPQIIALVKQNQFHGLPTEHPMDHIDFFEEICGTTRSFGVPEDYLKCKLFPFSLADKAHRWLKTLPAGSITTWRGCKTAFLNHFYTKSRSNLLRSKLQNFQQGPVESFQEAWERFKDYDRDCPHHGFTDGHLMSTFYRGLHPKYQLSLDTASNGDFATKTVPEGRALIDNLAASNSNGGADFDRTTRPNDSDSKQIVEFKNMMSQLLKNNQRPIHAFETIGGAEEENPYEFDPTSNIQEEEVNYVGAQGNYQNRGYGNNFNNNFRNTSNLSYRNPNVENPQDQFYPQNPRPVQNKFQGANYGGNNFQPRAPYNNNMAPFPTGPAQAPIPRETKLEMMMQ